MERSPPATLGAPSTRPSISTEQSTSSVFADSGIEDMASLPDVSRDSPTKSVSQALQSHENVVPGASRSTRSLSPVMQSLSDKMRQLAAATWALEQDDEMSSTRRIRIAGILRGLEEVIEDDSIPDTRENTEAVSTDEIQLPTPKRDHATRSPLSDAETPQSDIKEVQQDDTGNKVLDSDEELDEYIDQSDLYHVHDSLAQTVQSMRLRHQEQRHLHMLTVQKLETVAQRCLAQEAQLRTTHQELRSLHNEMSSLRTETKATKEENDTLRFRVEELEAESQRKEVAVSAMASAVKGLEGWIDSNTPQPSTPTKSYDNNNYAHQNQQYHRHIADDDQQHGYRQASPFRPLRGNSNNNHSPSPATNSPRHSIIRGKGRFRGRVFVDDRNANGDQFRSSQNSGYGGVNGTDAQDLQDGVKAWIRGFRDVEECVSMTNSPNYLTSSNHGPDTHRFKSRQKVEDANADADDQWGDFESAVAS